MLHVLCHTLLSEPCCAVHAVLGRPVLKIVYLATNHALTTLAVKPDLYNHTHFGPNPTGTQLFYETLQTQVNHKQQILSLVMQTQSKATSALSCDSLYLRSRSDIFCVSFLQTKLKANDVKASNVTVLSAVAADLLSESSCTNGAINGICIGALFTSSSALLLLLPLSCLLCVCLLCVMHVCPEVFILPLCDAFCLVLSILMLHESPFTSPLPLLWLHLLFILDLCFLLAGPRHFLTPLLLSSTAPALCFHLLFNHPNASFALCYVILLLLFLSTCFHTSVRSPLCPAIQDLHGDLPCIILICRRPSYRHVFQSPMLICHRLSTHHIMVCNLHLPLM